MKRSIRKQYSVIFIGTMAGTLALCWLLNNLFLEKYYTREKEKNLLQVHESINEAMESGEDTDDFFSVTLTALCGRYNIDGLVVDTTTQEWKVFGADAEQSRNQLWDNIFFLDSQPEDYLLQTDLYKMMIVNDKRIKTDYLELWGNLDNGDVFLLRTPLEGIRDSVQIANRFLAYIGIVTSIASGILIWLLTGKYSRPIMDLAKISERVAHLDFEARYTGPVDNEIGVLGENINYMSQELEKTISELKTANNELTRDIQKKNKVEQMRTEFLSNVSHELKTPIALIQGYAEGLRDGMPEEQEDREFYCNVIVDEAQKMNEMVRKLLTLNQLEYGTDTVSMERFDITALITNYLQSAEILVKKNEVMLKVDAPEAVFVWADEFKTEEVFTNYFSNALNHVQADAEGIKRIRIDLVCHEDLVRVNVFNTGKPIEEESLPLLWDKFYKVDKARTREYGGSGVGLSIVKAIMESMNREYGVENKEDGVLFWFELERA
jgi:signal transduction histidine kinase